MARAAFSSDTLAKQARRKRESKCGNILCTI